MEIFLSAGDPSGDIAASRALAALKELKPDIRTFGLGGNKLAALGQHQLADPSRLAVLGFWEVAKHYPFFRRLFHDCLAEIDKRRPACAVLVDYPGFNLRIAKEIKKRGIPVVYYIAPQVWAWGKGRIQAIQELVDILLVILSFEEKFFREGNVRHEFVGHYLLEDIPKEYISSPIPNSKVLALLPGSRTQEIERMLPTMLAAGKLFCRESGCRIQIAAVKGRHNYESTLTRHDVDASSLVYDDARRVIFDSDLAVVASGTATLETAIIGRPMIVTYKTSWTTYQIAKRLIDLHSIGLVNLTAGKQVVPELIQGGMTPERISRTLSELQAPERSQGIKRELDTIPSILGGVGASHRVALAIMRVYEGRH